MTWVVPLALGGFAVLLMATFTMLSARRRHHAAKSPKQVVGPRVLVHDINDDRCTGCDACVAVCPTNVLDLVANKSRVLRFEDCIQCELCMHACPTEALVMFPEGATPPPLKVPEMDENFQTAVPGQYLIGEVAGKPLVKSAANLGRLVVEHMLRSGMRPGALGRGENVVDVAIVGSGPGGLSAALTCIQRGLSYVVLEKEQLLASTIARYPKGKLVMAEPYDTANVSFLPVFDSSKEQLIPIWKELIERVGLDVRQGESVETVQKSRDGSFEVRTTVASVRAQRVVLSIGTRGKPRTLQVPGENLPKVFSLLEDPDEWRGRNVLVVGGGDSACEAAVALADAGARVTLSYRGKGFNRTQPKNKATIESYAAEGRIKARLGSQVLQFDPQGVTIALADGQQKRYPNDAAFVLIGADPPVAWLEKMGIHFVERPHQYQLGKTDDLVRRFVPRSGECPEDAARAAAQILGGSTGKEPSQVAPPVVSPRRASTGQAVSGPRKWLRSATSIFSTRSASQMTPLPVRESKDPRGGRSKRFDAPVPLSEFAKRQRTGVTGHGHTGHGRRDQLSAGERTRILRMLRDEGGRLADEDSQVFIGAAPAARYELDLDDDSPAPAPMPKKSARHEIPAKPAVVVGLEKAKRSKRMSAAPPPVPSSQQPRVKPPSSPPVSRSKPMPAVQPPPPPQQQPRPTASRNVVAVQRAKPALPSPFNEPTRAVNDKELIQAVREAAGPGRTVFDEPTRMGNVDRLRDDPFGEDDQTREAGNDMAKFLPAATEIDPSFVDHSDENEATRMADVGKIVKAGRDAPRADERTRAVNIRGDNRTDPSMSDIDWDID